MESAQEVTKPSTPFPEFSPCKNAFEFFASHECVDAMSPPRSTRTVRTPTSIKSLHNTSDSSKRFFGPGEAVGLIEAFFGAPNTITLTAHAPSLVWACPRAVIQSALYSSAISATEMKPIIKTALGKDLEERAKRNVLQQDVPLLKDLQHVRDIGNGSYGSVSLVRDTGTNGKDRMYAMKKIVRKSMVNKVQRQLVRNEREVMGIMDSKFIVHLHATYRDANNLYFLMEPALGGDMFTFMHKQRESLNDVEAFVRYASASVALALQHMHARKVIYRDLKPENVLVTCEGCLKVCDFGLSKLCVTMAQTMCGTPEYVAPEVLNHEGYTHMVDWWALGVFIYELFSDQVPFQADDFEVLSRKIRHGISSARFPRQIFSPIAESVVQALCNSDASRRLCASHGLKELCCHPFFMDFAWHDLASGTMEPPFTPPLTPISKCEALVTCSNVISP